MEVAEVMKVIGAVWYLLGGLAIVWLLYMMCDNHKPTLWALLVLHLISVGALFARVWLNSENAAEQTISVAETLAKLAGLYPVAILGYEINKLRKRKYTVQAVP